MKLNSLRGVGVFVVGILLFGANGRASIIPGYTCSVASQSGLPLVGTHFHSDHAGAFGNPADMAEVGSLQDQALSMETCRGLSEFNITGESAGSAMLRFSVASAGGLFPLQNGFPFTGTIGLLAYNGNNADDISDYSIATLGPIGTFSTSGLSVGSVVTFDVTSYYNSQIALGATSLGVRLQVTPATVTGGGAWTFDSFSLVTVPEPGAAIMGMSMLGLSLRRRRR